MTDPQQPEPADLSEPVLSDLGRVHLLGMAGVGVSGVARILSARGVPVSGTDAKDLPVLEEFRGAGVPVRVGYRAENLASVEEELGGELSTVIASSIATEGNPEYDEARRRGLRVLHRSQGLAAAMAGTRGIAVAGTHGKTTTSSMTTVLLERAGRSPSFAVGATVAGLGVNAAAGRGEWFVAEADESDGSLLNYAPEVAVVTNVEADHLDHHGTAEAVHQVFVDFTARIVEGGTLILCLDDDGAAQLMGRVRSTLVARGVGILTYGFSEEADLRITGQADGAEGRPGQLLTVADSRAGHEGQVSLRLGVPGRHNALNALAALAVGRHTGLDLDECAAALEHFEGAARRFELKGEAGGVRVYDDYAHHPTEVAAVLAAARSVVGAGRVHAVFQPHLFSRTRLFAEEFARALAAADQVALLEIYPAREEPLPGVTSALIGESLFSGADAPGGGLWSEQEAVTELAAAAEPGDIVLTLGAGDVTTLGPRIVEALRR